MALTEKAMTSRITLVWNGPNGELSYAERIRAVVVVDETGAIRHRTEAVEVIDIAELSADAIAALEAEVQRVSGVMAQKAAVLAQAQAEQAVKAAADAKAAAERS